MSYNAALETRMDMNSNEGQIFLIDRLDNTF